MDVSFLTNLDLGLKFMPCCFVLESFVCCETFTTGTKELHVQLLCPVCKLQDIDFPGESGKLNS